jgi:hypothetical protein
MQPPVQPLQKVSFMAAIKKHKINAGISATLFTLGISALIMAIYTTPSLSELFNGGDQASRNLIDCWDNPFASCKEQDTHLKKIRTAQRLLTLGISCLIAAGCTFGFGPLWKEYRGKKGNVSLPAASLLRSSGPLPAPLPNGFSPDLLPPQAPSRPATPELQPADPSVTPPLTASHHDSGLDMHQNAGSGSVLDGDRPYISPYFTSTANNTSAQPSAVSSTPAQLLEERKEQPAAPTAAEPSVPATAHTQQTREDAQKVQIVEKLIKLLPGNDTAINALNSAYSDDAITDFLSRAHIDDQAKAGVRADVAKAVATLTGKAEAYILNDIIGAMVQ